MMKNVSLYNFSMHDVNSMEICLISVIVAVKPNKINSNVSCHVLGTFQNKITDLKTSCFPNIITMI